MLLAVALATNRKGSRGHLVNLINPLSVRKGLRYPKKMWRASRKPDGQVSLITEVQVGFTKDGSGRVGMLLFLLQVLAGPLVRQNGNQCIFDKKSVNQNLTQELSEKLMSSEKFVSKYPHRDQIWQNSIFKKSCLQQILVHFQCKLAICTLFGATKGFECCSE